MDDFSVDNLIEVRSDNPSLKGYRVHLNNKTYVLYYENDLLREVYFMSLFDDYFMSCRTDMKTISHYYRKSHGVIRRYENGEYNRSYYTTAGFAFYYKHSQQGRIKVTYRTLDNIKINNADQLLIDLSGFLQEFNERKMYRLFSPKEPIK